MKAAYQELVDNSLAATLSAIEIYNKPDFQYRNETFVILIINAWELLLKAKILKENNHNKKSLYVKDGNKYKKSRTGNFLTIEIRGALNRLEVHELARQNIEAMLEIRDTAIHFYNKDTISYTIFALGAGTLQNYQKIIRDWFKRDLSDYNFYILPLGFKYSFKNFGLIEISKEPEAVQNLLRHILQSQASGKAENKGFYLVADIETKVVSAKKIADESHLTIAIDPSAPSRGIIRNQRVTDLYPYTALEVLEIIRETLPNVKRNILWDFIKLHHIKDNTKYSAYNFPSKKYEQEYNTGKLRATPASLYNQDAIEFILSNIEE